MPYDLAAALKASSANAVLHVPPGDYGDVAIKGVDRSTAPVTIKPQDPANPPVFRTFEAYACAGLIIEDLKVRLGSTRGVLSHTPLALFRKCEGVRLLRPDVFGGDAIEGSPASIAVTAPRKDTIIGFPVGYGIHIDECAKVSVEWAKVRSVGRGIVPTNSKDVQILDADIADVRFEHVSFKNMQGLSIQRHHLGPARPWEWGTNGDHGDFIHGWTEAGKPPNSNVRILDGLIDTGAGFAIMGIFLEDRNADSRGGAPGYPGLDIGGNTILGGNNQGIYLINAEGKVADNLMLQTVGDAKAAPSVYLEGRNKVAFTGNRSHDVHNVLERPPAGCTSVGNVRIATTPAMVLEARKEWLAKHRPAAVVPVPPPVTPPAPVRDELREALRPMTSAKVVTPPTTKGRLQIDFPTQAKARAALAAILADRPA
jgi:hypothetical protein